MRHLLIFAAAALAAAQPIDPAKLKEDLRIAKTALEEGHGGVYRYTPKAEFDRIWDRAAATLTRPMTALEFYRVIAPAVGAVKCGHTSIVPPNNPLPGLLPLDVVILDGKVFVRRDHTPEGKLAGAEIRAINGVGAQKLVADMTAVVTADGNTMDARAWRIGSGGRFPTLLYTLEGLESPFKLKLGDGREVELQGMPAANIPRPPRPAEAADFKSLDDGRIGVLTVRTFGGSPGGGKRLNEFFPETFASLERQGAKALILDLRNNGGGEDALGKQLFSLITDKPFDYYDDLVINKLKFDFAPYSQPAPEVPAERVERRADGKYHLVTHPNWGQQPPSKGAFLRPVYALVNGGSFSATCEFLSVAKFHNRVTVIGEEPGGGFYGNTSGFTPAVTLPNSKLVLRVPLITYYVAVKRADKPDRSVLPDYPVRYTIAEILAGKDKEMELALSLARAAH